MEAHTKAPGGLWHGWAMLGVASVALVATSPGQTFLVSLFNLEMRRELGLSASALSGAYMMATLGSASLMTWVGKGSDRWGPGRFMAGAALGLWFATFWMSGIQGFASLAVGFFLLRLCGQGALSLASGHALAMWFERRLGIAEGVRLTVFGLGMLVSPALVTLSIASFGWRATWPLIGTLTAGAVLVLVVFVHRDRPEDVGSTLDGVQVAPEQESGVLTGADLSAAVRDPAFWAVTAVTANSAMVVTALMFHIQPLAVAKGLDVSAAPGLIAAYALLSTSLFFVCGWLGDRLRPNLVFASAALLLAAGGVSFTSVSPSWAPYVGMGAMGTASALLGTSATPTLARCFGRAHHGAIRGLVTTIAVAGTAVGPFVLGVSMDLTTSFDVAVWGFVGGGVVVALGVALAPIAPLGAVR